VETYDLEVARAPAALLVYVWRSGGHDLIIAATAVARRRSVVRDDVAGFEGLPGVGLVSVPAGSLARRGGRMRA
jgi:predicted nucleic acid-binding protein